MSTTLRDAAARAARQDEIATTEEPRPTDGITVLDAKEAKGRPGDLDPMADYEIGEVDPDLVPVHLAWLRVRRDIKKIEKKQKYDAPGTKYNFRGVDAVLNNFGPVTLRHGVNVLPIKVEANYRDTTTAQNKKTRECTVLVTYQIIGPKGDCLIVQSAGENLDSGDKGTSKALAVALRTLLLHGGLVPTGDPDPDSTHVERGDATARSARDYLKEILEPETSLARLRQIHFEIRQARIQDTLVPDERGENVKLADLLLREGQRRSPQPEGAPATTQRQPAKHDHEGDYSPDCAPCKAEQAAADRELAGGDR